MKIVGKTDIGMVRESNQDTFKIVAIGQGAGFALVCDGMGGVSGGDRASSIAKRTITDTILENFRDGLDTDGIHKIILKAIYAANQAIYQNARQDHRLEGMGTTVVLVVLVGKTAYVGHVGDSRLYQYQGDCFFQVTRDHSRVQELLDEGAITEEQAKVHPQKNMITRAVGIGKDVNVDLLDLPFLPGEKLLLCTDGLTGLCSDEEIAPVLAHKTPEEAAKSLIQMANNAGGYDNITVVIVENQS